MRGAVHAGPHRRQAAVGGRQQGMAVGRAVEAGGLQPAARAGSSAAGVGGELLAVGDVDGHAAARGFGEMDGHGVSGRWKGASYQAGAPAGRGTAGARLRCARSTCHSTSRRMLPSETQCRCTRPSMPLRCSSSTTASGNSAIFFSSTVRKPSTDACGRRAAWRRSAFRAARRARSRRLPTRRVRWICVSSASSWSAWP